MLKRKIAIGLGILLASFTITQGCSSIIKTEASPQDRGPAYTTNTENELYYIKDLGGNSLPTGLNQFRADHPELYIADVVARPDSLNSSLVTGWYLITYPQQ